MVRSRDILQFLLQWIHCVMNREALARILMIVVDDRLAGQFRYAHDAVGIIHTVLLNTIDSRIHLTTRTVEVSCMYVNAERLTAHILGMDTSWIGKPIMSMNDIELFGSCHNASNYRVVVDLIVQIAGITTGKLHSTQIIDVHIIEVCVDMLTEFKIVVGIHYVTHTTLHIVVVNITIGNRHGIHGNDASRMRFFITKRMRQTKCNLYIALSFQTFRDSIVGSSKTTKNVRRILPSKH